MLDTLHASPSAGSYCQEPMSASEIDAHPDCARIWATIVALREDTEKQIQEKVDDHNGEMNAAREDQRDLDATKIDVWLHKIWSEFEDEYSDLQGLNGVKWLHTKLSEAGGQL